MNHFKDVWLYIVFELEGIQTANGIFTCILFT